MASPPGANRVSDVLHRGAHAVVNHVRRAPATHAYVFTLLVTTAVVHTLDRRVADELLRQVSTNLYEMGRDALRVLLLSAFLLDGPQWLSQVLLVSIVVGTLERRIGTSPMIVLVTVGHFGATLVTTAGIWANVRFGHSGGDLVRAVDVGASYVMFAAAGAVVMGLGRWRRSAQVGLALEVGVPLALRHTFTDAGHVAAAAIGASFVVVLAAASLHAVPRQPTSAGGDPQHGRDTVT